MRALLGSNVIKRRRKKTFPLQTRALTFCQCSQSLFVKVFRRPTHENSKMKKCHLNRGHGASLVDQAQQSKKPCRVPLEMFLHSQGRQSLLIEPSACPAPPIPTQQGHCFWMLSPPLRDEQSSRHLPVASSQPLAARWLCLACWILLQQRLSTNTWQTTQLGFFKQRKKSQFFADKMPTFSVFATQNPSTSWNLTLYSQFFFSALC